MKDINWLIFGSLFTLSALTDTFYAVYVKAITNSQPFKASSVSFFMHFMMALGTIQYVENPYYILAIASGSFVGTFIIVKYQKK
jgi:hypothetical protein